VNSLRMDFRYDSDSRTIWAADAVQMHAPHLCFHVKTPQNDMLAPKVFFTDKGTGR
jgi:hypothetical protein